MALSCWRPRTDRPSWTPRGCDPAALIGVKGSAWRLTKCSEEAVLVNSVNIAIDGDRGIQEVAGLTTPTGIDGQQDEDLVTNGERGGTG
jgi:hypothetical protein